MEDKKQKLCAAALACVVLLAGLVWFLCAGRSDVSDIRRGAQSVTEQLDRAESGQREETKSIDRAAEAASDSQRAAGEIQSIERRDADLISGKRRNPSASTRTRQNGKSELRQGKEICGFLLPPICAAAAIAK